MEGHAAARTAAELLPDAEWKMNKEFTFHKWRADH
jgi:hypothetical protein